MRSPVQTHAQPPGATGVLVCSDESIIWGKGLGLPASLLERFVLTRL